MPAAPQDLTGMVQDLARGDTLAADRMMPILYDELHRAAEARLAREAREISLRPTDVIHEVYLRLVKRESIDWQGKTHFFAVAAQEIRRVLVEHARRRLALKHGAGRRRVTLDTGAVGATEPPLDLLNLEDALQKLSQLDARQAKVVELRFFGGLSIEQTALTMGVSPRTVVNTWKVARAWLRETMGDQEQP